MLTSRTSCREFYWAGRTDGIKNWSGREQTSKGNGHMTAKKYHGCCFWWHIYVKVLRVRGYFCPHTLPVFRLDHLHISLFYFSHIDSSHHVVFLLFNNLQKGQNLLKQEAHCRTIADMLKSRHVSLVNQLNTHSLSVTNQMRQTSNRSRFTMTWLARVGEEAENFGKRMSNAPRSLDNS